MHPKNNVMKTGLKIHLKSIFCFGSFRVIDRDIKALGHSFQFCSHMVIGQGDGQRISREGGDGGEVLVSISLWSPV